MKLTSTIIATAAFVLPALGNPIVKRQSFPTVTKYDDQNCILQYDGAWTRLRDQGGKYYDGTLSYTSQPNAQIIIPNPTGQNQKVNITIYSSLKGDRGKFNVYSGHTLLGTGNEYTSASSETNSQVVFQYNATDYLTPDSFVIKNDRGAKYLAFDAIELYYNAP